MTTVIYSQLAQSRHLEIYAASNAKTVEKLNIERNKNVHPILRPDCDFLKNENILSCILEHERFVIYDKYCMRSE